MLQAVPAAECSGLRCWMKLQQSSPAHRHTSSVPPSSSLPSSRSGLCCTRGAKDSFWRCMDVRGVLDSRQSFKGVFGVLSTSTALLRSAMVLRAARMWESGWWSTGALTLPAPRYFPVLGIPWHSCCPRGHSPDLSLNPFVSYV